MSRYASLFTGDGVSPDSKAEGTGPAGGQRYQLLFVDDEPNVLRALQRIFREERYQISTAPNGQEALRLMENQRFHLVISDYMMPGMSGTEMLKQARRLQPDMIRILLTGNADVGAVMGAVNEGAVYKFILKPWHDDDLRITVALALEQFDLSQKNKGLVQENQKKNQEISKLSKLAIANRSQLGILLHRHGLLGDQQLQELHKLQQARKEPLIKLLLKREWVKEKALRDLLRKELRVEEVSLAEIQVSPALASLIPKAFCERQWVVPLKQEAKRLMLAMADPMDIGLIDDLRFVSGLEIQPVMANVEAILKKIREVYGGEDAPSFRDMETLINSDPFDGIEIVIDEEEVHSLEELLSGTEEPPAIRLVNVIIMEAIRLSASDIHIQPRTKSVVVRYRIDGILSDKIQIPHHLHMATVSRIKIMSELDIAERRKPQDGRVTVKTPLRIVDLRISTLPTINGEKVVMRLLDRNASVRSIEALGFQPRHLQLVEEMSAKPQGLILTTGPTGSGKTTSLYSLLQHNATPSKNYVTIEDPVEYYLDMAGQVHVKSRIGLDFPTVLRAILRQDPDVILLGEIRDLETAEVAFHAALTGHMVFSTLHTNSAIATIARLLDLGLKPYVVATALEGIIAQRLVRKICVHCRAPVKLDMATLEQLGPLFHPDKTRAFAGRGCDACHHSGYAGRLGIYEVLVPDAHMRHMIASGANAKEIMHLAKRLGMPSLLEDAREKMHQGLIDAREILRVLGPQGTGLTQCPHCRNAVESEFNYCPHCSTHLRAACRQCDAYLDPAWQSCPKCGTRK